MKFIRVLKASNKNYDEVLSDVVKNFEKIVGFPMEKIYHLSNGEIDDHSIWEEEFSQEAADKICKYVEKKYNISENDDDFIYALEEKLDSLYPY